MSELLNNYKHKKSLLQIGLKGIIELIIYASIFGLWLGSILFSNSSLSTSTDLEARIEYLNKEIDTLNKTNAQLQKDYFELLSIQGDYDN